VSASGVYALLGQPVAGNPTRQMVEAAWRAAGVDAQYVDLEVEPAALPDAFRGLRALGFDGGHVTRPHKIAAVALVDRLTPSAAAVGAVNCLRREDDGLAGDNTDGKGFLAALRAVTDPEGVHAAVLGAGGAARAVAVELALAGAGRITVVSRSPAPGRELAGTLRELGTPADAAAFGEAYAVGADVGVLVNGTSAGQEDADDAPPVDWSSAAPGLVAADVVITPGTRFLREAAAAGARPLDGLGMLVEQAVVGLRWWQDLDADRAAMHAAVRAALGLDGAA
jgi:shikimate dehydrogenase